MDVGGVNESDGHSLIGAKLRKGKVTRTASIAVDKAPLSLRARSGIDARLSMQARPASLE